jgi:hypothetical protein
MLATRKLSALLTTNTALSQAVVSTAEQAGVAVAALDGSQITLSSASPDLDDQNLMLTYPRLCIYATQVKNGQREKFRSFSGNIIVAIDVWSSGNQIADAEQSLHIYAEAVCSILRSNMGDWGDGFRFSGIYEMQMQPPKVGGFGFVDTARISCSLDVGVS